MRRPGTEFDDAQVIDRPDSIGLAGRHTPGHRHGPLRENEGVAAAPAFHFGSARPGARGSRRGQRRQLSDDGHNRALDQCEPAGDLRHRDLRAGILVYDSGIADNASLFDSAAPPAGNAGRTCRQFAGTQRPAGGGGHHRADGDRFGVLRKRRAAGVDRNHLGAALVPRASDPAPAVRVLKTLTQTSDPGHWAITRLGEGDHSTVYIVQSKDRQPVWREHDDLVVKLYKPEAALTPEMVEAQFDSLSRLHSALHGLTVNDWKISTPKPLHVCKSPLALVMTAVSAKKDLKSCAATDDDLTPEVLEAIGRAFIDAMQERWSRGQIHGDLALQNILYDVQGQNLSFIDPGTRECCTVCYVLSECWRPAVLELGHVLRDLGTDVRDMIGNPIARLRRQIFVESALRAFIEAIDSIDDKQRALDEIQACAQVHLSRVLLPSWSLRGLWHWLLTQLVVRRMTSILDGLRAELDTPDKPLGKSIDTFLSQTR